MPDKRSQPSPLGIAGRIRYVLNGSGFHLSFVTKHTMTALVPPCASCIKNLIPRTEPFSNLHAHLNGCVTILSRCILIPFGSPFWTLVIYSSAVGLVVAKGWAKGSCCFWYIDPRGVTCRSVAQFSRNFGGQKANNWYPAPTLHAWTPAAFVFARRFIRGKSSKAPISTSGYITPQLSLHPTSSPLPIHVVDHQGPDGGTFAETHFSRFQNKFLTGVGM